MTNNSLTNEYKNAGKIISADEPKPFGFISNPDSPVLFTGPHNGTYVPKSLALDEYFIGRHEYADIGMADCFEFLRRKNPEANYLWGNYSRLVADLNRTERYIVDTNSQETGRPVLMNKNAIPGSAEWKSRHEEIYRPFHEKLIEMVRDIKHRFGYIVLLDLHSFSPVYHEQERTKKIGTLYSHSNGLVSQAVNATLSRFAAEDFQPMYPYPAFQTSDRNKSHEISLDTGLDVENVIIEIRNDVLQETGGLDWAAELIGKSAIHAERELRTALAKKQLPHPRPDETPKPDETGGMIYVHS